jgi:hypothetical protein
MKVAAPSLLQRIELAGPARGRIEVEPQRTSVTKDQLRAAIARAHTELFGEAPSAPLLDVLTAHASLETGAGASMYNFNFGGIKGVGPTGMTARCRTHEVLGGREVTVRDGFRAYPTLDAGAKDYVALMRTRFAAAASAAETGDVRAFAHALKRAGYYTASEEDYAAGLLAHAPNVAPSVAAAERSAAASFPSTEEWSRLLDASAMSAAAILRPTDAEMDTG